MATATPLMIPVDKIVVQEGHNARKSFDPKALERLGKSISANDLIEPLSVRPIDGGMFMLPAGERRLPSPRLRSRNRADLSANVPRGAKVALH